MWYFYVHSSLYWTFQEIGRWWVCYARGNNKKSCSARVPLKASFQGARACFVMTMDLRHLWQQRYVQNWRKDCTGILPMSPLPFSRFWLILKTRHLCCTCFDLWTWSFLVGLQLWREGNIEVFSASAETHANGPTDSGTGWWIQSYFCWIGSMHNFVTFKVLI